MEEKILHPNKEEVDNLSAQDTLVLADFWATWCAPCRMLAPVIDQIAEQYNGKVVVAKIDVDEHNDLASQYGVQSIPTVIVFKKGEIKAREVGAKPLSSYTGLLDSLLG